MKISIIIFRDNSVQIILHVLGHDYIEHGKFGTKISKVDANKSVRASAIVCMYVIKKQSFFLLPLNGL